MASAHLRGLNKAELQDVGNEVGLPEYVAIPAPDASPCCRNTHRMLADHYATTDMQN